MEKYHNNYLSDISDSIAKFEKFKKARKVCIEPETKKFHIKILEEISRLEHTLCEEMVENL